MAKDNSTGKTKGFYERGQAIFDRIPGMPEDDAPAPSRLYDLREWLLSQIDGSEETRGDDSLISHFINQIDALSSTEIAEPRGCPTPGACSCPGAIPDAERKKVMDAHMLAESIVARATVATPRTDAATVRMERLDGDIDEVVSADFARTLERELIDIKQRLLPQYLGRAERAEKARQMAVVERDAILEKLRAATSMPCAPSATEETDRPDWARQLPGAELYDRDHGYDRTASLSAGHYVCTCGTCSCPDAGEKP